MKQLETIMVIEDNIDIQEIINITLEVVEGLDVNICSSCEEAIAKIGIFKPDLILLDVIMPYGMNGTDFLKKIQTKPETSSIPVVFLTARVQSSEISHYKELGAIDVIGKPFDPMTLAETINNIWISYNEQTLR